MKKTRRFPTVVRNVFASALAIVLLAQCTDEPKVENSPAPAAEVETVSNVEDAPMMSLTIDGVHTVITTTAECKKCDYVVPEDATIVDGKKIGIKPGQAICLTEGVNYGNLEFINLEGTEKDPIIVAYTPKEIVELASNQ